ncbi:MAG: PKD domain-containing protein [Candidatus Lokiarchaeota archaeon]|nr:PKD domain-containing protein [Candidatus Lokiarchaeota archaeon]
MEKYNEILGLNKYFKPYYDITNESYDYWKNFIVNDKFYDVLRGVLNCLDGQSAKDKKSIWVQGTYGTGKSHATGVIKHLLFEPMEKIADFFNNFNNEQLKSRLKRFRENNRVFPVVLKGVSNITNNSSFSLEIEKAVKEGLKNNGISVKTKSDFEKVINHIEQNPLNIDWDKNIQDHPELSMYVKDKEDLINKLSHYDKGILQTFEELSSKTLIHFSQEKIEEWLTSIIDELRQKNIADKLVIYWDEFTSVLELQNSGILLAKLQDIAELAENKEIYLFVVSHRRPHQTRLKQEDIDHILGRFESIDYSMEPITTYHIIGSAIQKKDKKLWERVRNDNVPSIESVIKIISGNEGSFVTDLIRNLFPLHPYTAYLSTFIARNIGSTERSIFKFLYDEEKGFIKFINENPMPNGCSFLMPDYLFDFFLDEFERSTDQRFSSVLDKFNLHSKSVVEENENYYAIFKGVLLLNLLYKVVSVDESYNSLVSPNFDNINAMFCGSKYLSDVDECLNFFNTKQILSRNPDNLYLVESSALPVREIEKTKDGLRNNYNTIEKILADDQKKELINYISSLILRQAEINIFDASLQEHLFKNYLSKAFNKDHTIHIALIISKNLQERAQIVKTITSILSDDMFANIIFILLDDILSQEKIESFLDYHARALVAERHNLKEEQMANINYAKKLIDQWIQSAKTSTVDWFLRSVENEKVYKNKSKDLLSDIPKIVNEELSLKIFKFGIENLIETRKNVNAWSYQMSKASAENFLFAEDLNSIEQKTVSGPSRYTREILKNNSGQYIVRDNLSFCNDMDQEHPLLKMWKEVQLNIDSRKGGVFNIGDVLEFLSKSPYGLYPNMVNMATLGFLMRNYTGKLYEAGTGKPIEKEIMRDKVIALFDYWTKRRSGDKLEVRLGTEEEKKLVSDLCEIFEFKHKESLNDTKWAIREWIKSVAMFPLWIFELIDDISDGTSDAIKAIIYLVESVDRDFTQEDIKDAWEMINSVKTDLMLLFQKYEQCENLFINWLDNIDNITIEENKHSDVIEYVRRHMPEEIGVASWTESKVREIVKDWYIQKDEPVSNLKTKFTFEKQSNHAPLEVRFFNESEGTPVSWEWNFDVYGSGATSDEKYPVFIYENSGTYTVSLKIVDGQGNVDQLIKENCIEVNDVPDEIINKKEEIVKKILNYQGDFRSLLIKLVNENENLLNILDKYLSN